MTTPLLEQQRADLLNAIRQTHPVPGAAALWWLGQHGFVFKIAGRTLYIDVFFSDLPDRLTPPLLLPDEPGPVDLVFGTHDHADHIDRDAWPILAQAAPRTKFVVPDLLADAVAHDLQIDRERVIGINDGETVSVDGVQVTGVAAAHEFLDRDPLTGRYPYLGYILEADGLCLYHAGDTCLHEGLLPRLRGRRYDAALLPINGRDAKRLRLDIIGNMTYQEAADLAGQLEPELTLPTHFDMFAANAANPAEFVDYLTLKYPHLASFTPRLGERIDLPWRRA